ncbi:Lysophospholipase, partial [hydrothermal vent metagenome]
MSYFTNHFNPGLSFKLTLTLALALTLASCGETEQRFRPSGLNSTFDFAPDTPFDAYIKRTKEMTGKARLDLTEANREKIIEAVSPFELKPASDCATGADGKYEKGILLVHGLSDSPYLTRAIGEHFQSRCFLVRSILLPGHGTVPGDLLDINDEEWIKAVDYGLYTIKGVAQNVYIGGYSTGGALAIYEGLRHEEIKAIILFSPAIGFKNSYTGLALRLYRHVRRWLEGRRDDLDFAKYETFATNAVVELAEIMDKNRAEAEKTGKLMTPLFAALSYEDISVSADKTIRFFSKYLASPESRMILYARNPESLRFDDSRIVAIKSRNLKERILDFAHISILIPPDDPHYGKEGEYKSCLHYDKIKEKKKWHACKNDEKSVWQGVASKENMNRGVVRRLTYNPLYK